MVDTISDWGEAVMYSWMRSYRVLISDVNWDKNEKLCRVFLMLCDSENIALLECVRFFFSANEFVLY